MSGIAGRITFEGDCFGKTLVERMIQKLKHRGRDETVFVQNKGVCMANCRQKLFDCGEELKWSLSNSDGSVFMAYDGEVFNFLDLRETLHRRGCSFHGNSDAEVVLSLYLEFGMDFVNMLDGAYAIAIFDFNKNEGYLIRDILGAKPLFYYRAKDSLYFASEIKAIAVDGIYDPKIDYLGLKDYLHIQLYLGNKTLFRDITYVSEATYLKIDLKTGYTSEIRYWEMPSDELDITYNDAVEYLNILIEKSVAACCRADGNIAAFVSGGLDSSVIATIASQYCVKNKPDKLITYSSIYPYMDLKDESEKSDAVVANLISEHNRVILDTQEMITAHTESLMYKMDMPEAGYAAPYMLMNRIVKKRSNIVLTGNGGDELFAGYPKYIAASVVDMINRSYHEKAEESDLSFIKYVSGFEMQFKNIINRAIFGDESELVKSLFYRSESLWDEVDAEIKKETADYDVAREIWGLAKDRPTGFLRRLMYLDQKILFKGLLHIDDRASAVESLNGRSPLISKEIVEFAARVPEKYLLRNGLKSLMRDVARLHIPAEVADNKNKSGMLYPMPEFLYKYMSERLYTDISMLDATGLFNRPAASMVNLTGEPIYGRNAWGLWCISTWHRSFLG